MFFWTLTAFDMTLLSPTTFRSIPAVLLSGSVGWFVARAPSEVDWGGRLLSGVQSPISAFVDDHRGRRKDSEDQVYHLSGFSGWTTVHLVWLAVQMKQDGGKKKKKLQWASCWGSSLRGNLVHTSASWLHMCNLTIALPPTNVDAAGCF